MQNQTINFEFIACIDTDNNHYSLVTIGAQTWMAENLAYLPVVHSNSEFQTLTNNLQLGYGVYGYDGSDVATAKYQENYKTYGVLYNWWAAMNACPTGWHLPTDPEWTELVNYFITNGYNYDGTTTENKIAKSLAASSGWISSSITGAVGNLDYSDKKNISGFSALPGGARYGSNGLFNKIGSSGFWFSASLDNTGYAWGRYIYCDNSNMSSSSYNMTNGLSVRCVKNYMLTED